MDVIHYWQMNEEINLYAIPIAITNPDTGASLIKSCVFDTGYSGYLGLDFETINYLGLVKVGGGEGYTVSGKIEYETYVGTAAFGNVPGQALEPFKNLETELVQDMEEKQSGIIP